MAAKQPKTTKERMAKLEQMSVASDDETITSADQPLNQPKQLKSYQKGEILYPSVYDEEEPFAAQYERISKQLVTAHEDLLEWTRERAAEGDEHYQQLLPVWENLINDP